MKAQQSKQKREISLVNEETQKLQRENSEDIIDFTGREPFDDQDIPVLFKKNKLEKDRLDNKDEEEFFKSTFKSQNQLFFFEFSKSFLNNFLILIGVFFYIKSFSIYSDFPEDCIDEINEEKLHLIFKYILLSAISFISEIFFFILGYSYIYVIILEIVSVIFICNFYRNHYIMHENIFIYHKIIFCTVSVIILFICIIFYFLREVYTTKKFKYVAITLSLCTLILIFLKESKENYEDLSKGFSSDLNTKYVETPSIYTYQTLNYFQNYFIDKEVCSEINEFQKENLVKNYGDSSNSFIRFPNTNNILIENMTKGSFENQIKNNLLYLNNKEQNSINEINFNLTTSLVEINFEPNNTLITERGTIYNKTKDTISTENILIIYLDSVSKNQFIRDFKKTLNFMKNFINNSSQKYESFEFSNFKFDKKYNTNELVKQTLFNFAEGNEKANYYLKYFKEKGFITGNAINWCGKEVFRTDESDVNLQWETYDHEFVSIFCDPNFVQPLTTDKKCPTFIRKSCFYNTHSIDLLVSYSMSFWMNYKSQAKVFRLGIMDGVDYLVQNMKYIDEKVSNLLTSFDSLESLKNTTIFIYSNHGSRNSILFSLFKNNDYNFEKVRPTLYIIISKSLHYYKQFSENLNNNKYKEISHTHIYDSLVSLVWEERNLKSLFF